MDNESRYEDEKNPVRIRTYANTYQDYTKGDLEKLGRFDVVAIEPYSLPNREFVGELKKAGTQVLAYVSIGEADNERRYWSDWKPDERTPDNPEIGRSTVTAKDPMFIGTDPGWEGSYFVDASNAEWRDILLNQEIPYILWLGGGRFDGLVMDLVDVVDEYEGKPGEQHMRAGMVSLIKAIDEKYPDLSLVPNRGFGILPEMAPYIDAFKFEEMNGAYGTVKGEPRYHEYYLKVSDEGERENSEELDLLAKVLKKHPMPVLVLDHIQTEPPDEKSARRCSDLATQFGKKHNIEILWYGNSVDQDLPLWPFLPIKDKGGISDGRSLVYADQEGSAQNPAFSPDGGSLLITIFHEGYNEGPAGLYTLPLGGGTKSRLIDKADHDCVNLPGTSWNGATNLVAFAADLQGNDEIWTIGQDGKGLRRVTRHTDKVDYIEPSFSPDGQWIVFERAAGNTEETQQGSIWKVRSDGTGLTRLTSGADDRQPNWSPTGDRILFQRREAGSDNWDIYTISQEGTEALRVTISQASDTDASWSPDGKWMVYSTDHGGLELPNIFIIPAEGGEPIRVTRDGTHEDGAASWSPEGKRIVFESHEGSEETTPASIYLVDVPPL
ncbi:MAG: endo alpha-1,4 polygalactosaminidase [Candidatus Geothermincolia bacterium]